jgi:hypothetical protein
MVSQPDHAKRLSSPKEFKVIYLGRENAVVNRLSQILNSTASEGSTSDPESL